MKDNPTAFSLLGGAKVPTQEKKQKKTTENEQDDDNQDLDFSLPSCSNETTSKTPDTFNQGELNDLVRDLCLSKESAELLASRLAEK